jgi:YVTN family beta-propeller protein
MTKKLFGLLTITLLVSAGLGAAPNAYVANLGVVPNTISVIDTATNTAVDTITSSTATVMSFLLPSPDGQWLYTSSPRMLERINTSSKALAGTINDAAANFASLAISPDGKTLYAIDQAAPNIRVIDTASFAEIDTISGLPLTSFMNYMVVTPNGQKGYVANGTEVVVIQLESPTMTIIPIPGAGFLNGIAVSPNGAMVYVSDQPNGALIMIDTVLDAVVDTISTGNTAPEYLAITPDGKYLYTIATDTGTFDRVIGRLDTTTDAFAVVADLGSGVTSQFIGVTPDGKTLYAPAFTGLNNMVDTLTVADNTPGTVADGNFNIPLPLGMPGGVQPPTNLTGTKTSDVFLTQIDWINYLTWTAPSPAPASYSVYRDAALTQLAGSTTTTSFADHDRTPGKLYTYYVVSVDAFGNKSIPVSTTVQD